MYCDLPVPELEILLPPHLAVLFSWALNNLFSREARGTWVVYLLSPRIDENTCYERQFGWVKNLGGKLCFSKLFK